MPFVIGFVVAMLTAASYVELVGKYPRAAGAALYTQKAFRVPFGVDFPAKLFALIALLAVSNSALINIMMASRLCYGLASERVLPRGMARVLPGRRTPVVGIVFVTAPAIGIGLWIVSQVALRAAGQK